jgi:hypothetical protein
LKPDLQERLWEFEEPLDEEELKALILYGATPTKDDISEYIRRLDG